MTTQLQLQAEIWGKGSDSQLESPSYWSVVEVEPNEWWAIDMTTGAACLITVDAGERLWKSHDLLDRPLAVALNAGEMGQRRSRFVDLDFLGVSARYTCEDPTMADRISSLYAGMVPVLRRSPDVLLQVGRSADYDRLHRAVAERRDGVEFREVTSNRWCPGSTQLPIIPPLQSPRFAGRFCALHAALLRTHRSGVLVCGAQRAGKTSAALLASRLDGAVVLADEMVILDERGIAFGVPLPVRERTADDRAARALPRTTSFDGGVKVRLVVVLENAGEIPLWNRVDDATERMRRLAPHIRVLDGPIGRATASVLTMLQFADVQVWHLRAWPRLMEDLEYGFREHLGLGDC